MDHSRFDRIKKLGTLLSLMFFIYIGGELGSGSAKTEGIQNLIDLQKQKDIKWTHIVLQQSGIVDHEQSEEEWKQMKEKIGRIFELELNLMSSGEHGSGIIRYEGIKSLTSDRQLRIAWIGQEEENKAFDRTTYHTFLIVEFSTGRLEEWERDYQYIESKIKEVGIVPEIHVSVEGRVDQIMTEEEVSRYLRDMIMNMNGEVKEGLVDRTVTSLSGYSPQFTRSIRTNNGHINFQIMAYTDEQKKATKIILGTPIITTDH